MPLTIPQDLRAPWFRGHKWKRVRNASGTAIPPHSVVRITGADVSSGEIVLTVAQPNASSTTFQFDGYLVTGPLAIGSGSSNEGYATDLSEPGLVRYDSSGTPAVGAIWGPKHGQFSLSLNYYGYTTLGGNTTSAGNSVTVAKWSGAQIVIGKIDDASVSLGSTCTVSVYVGTTYQTDSTMNITGVVNRGTTLTGLSSPYCAVSYGNGIPVLMWVACT